MKKRRLFEHLSFSKGNVASLMTEPCPFCYNGEKDEASRRAFIQRVINPKEGGECQCLK